MQERPNNWLVHEKMDRSPRGFELATNGKEVMSTWPVSCADCISEMRTTCGVIKVTSLFSSAYLCTV